MKKYTISLIFTTILLTLSPFNPLAAKLDSLPSMKSSNQWKVKVGKADSDIADQNKSTKPELYSVYSMDIKNNGDQNVQFVKIEAYRDEPNSTTEFELFTVDFENMKNSVTSFHHNNFPLYKKATKLKVFVTWTEKKNNYNHNPRKYREEFVFQQ